MSAPHFRFDVWTQAWVAMAPGRFAIGAMRPGGLPPSGARCPFCPGHEADTEESVAEIGSPWRTRAVRNRFPLVDEGEGAEAAADRLDARGAHEVLIESRHHDLDLAARGEDDARDVLRLWRARARALGARADARAVVLFRNRGRRAGSSQPHPHSQIVALPYVPPHVATRARAARLHREAHGDALVPHLVGRERADGRRIVLDADGVVAFCPLASPRAWLVRLALEDALPRLAEASDAHLEALARALPRVVRAALAASGASDYNVFVADPPLDDDAGFCLEIVPRTGGDAGFELSTGTSVCVVLPEDAAQRMRSTSSTS